MCGSPSYDLNYIFYRKPPSEAGMKGLSDNITRKFYLEVFGLTRQQSRKELQNTRWIDLNICGTAQAQRRTVFVLGKEDHPLSLSKLSLYNICPGNDLVEHPFQYGAGDVPSLSLSHEVAVWK